MKFFHLADLHLGKCIHGYSMIEMGDQTFYIEQLLQKAEALKPDAVLIAGDVYDRAVPSKEAVRLFDELLTAFAAKKVPVLIIAGNHDSGTRLAFADQLLRHQGIYLAGEVKKEVTKVVLYDEYGPVNFWLVPYLFPAAVNTVLGREDIKDYDTAMKELLSVQEIDYRERNVILSHQFVVAGGEKPSMGGSETTIGGIGQVEADLFEKFDYTALGHIHNAQRMGRETVRYAGSPLSYHFSEAAQKKGLTVVELKEKGQFTVTVEKLQVLHEMIEVSGSLEELLSAEVPKNSYIRAVITQELLPPQAVECLRNYFESKECVLMEVVREVSYKKRKQEEPMKDVRTMSLEELFGAFYQEQYQGELPEKHIEQLISFTAEQTRNEFSDRTEKERQEAMRKLIAFASKCKEDKV